MRSSHPAVCLLQSCILKFLHFYRRTACSEVTKAGRLVLKRRGRCELLWLSFVHNRRPQGQRFLGATIVVAADVKDAVQEARRLGINPGGEVSLIEFPAAVPPILIGSIGW